MMTGTVAVAAALALGTLASEDIACIAAGALVARGDVTAATAIASCVVGIFVGDLGLWAAGRAFGRVALQWRWLAGQIDGRRFRDLREWLRRNGLKAVFSSRFLPGTRVPLYVVAGIARLPLLRFSWWAILAVAVWTPALVLTSAALGAAAATRLPLVTATLALSALVVRVMTSAQRRLRLRAAFARWSRWEFWPMWLFYLPVGVRVMWLSIRYQGLSTITAANPGIADGGTVGESKAEILGRLPPEWTIAFALIRPAVSIEERRCAVVSEMYRRGWSFPIVLKPDVGQRGAGVRIARSAEDVEAYVKEQRGAIVVQPYHAGPFEAGIFYYRMPGDSRGRILSITDKHFPVAEGDGASTLEELIWRHPRHRLQAATFLARHHERRDRVLAKGERFPLAIAGNHAQGTLFLDGMHLITPALERRIDEIARSYDGFFIGRFDVRYSDVEAFKAGRDLAIVELNGATAESTNIYDPNGSLLDAYRQLFRQWDLVFAIGAANRARGAAVTPASRLVSLVRAHLAAPVAISD